MESRLLEQPKQVISDVQYVVAKMRYFYKQFYDCLKVNILHESGKCCFENIDMILFDKVCKAIVKDTRSLGFSRVIKARL